MFDGADLRAGKLGRTYQLKMNLLDGRTASYDLRIFQSDVRSVSGYLGNIQPDEQVLERVEMTIDGQKTGSAIVKSVGVVVDVQVKCVQGVNPSQAIK